LTDNGVFFVRVIVYDDQVIICDDFSEDVDMAKNDSRKGCSETGKRRVLSVDADTGETLEGVVVLVRKKSAFTRLYGQRWFVMAQDPLIQIATDRELTGESRALLFYLLARLDFDNFISLSQKEAGEALGWKKQNVSRAFKLLESKRLILRGPKLGSSYAWRLNPQYGFKGNPEGKVCRDTFQGNVLAFTVIEGGKKN
jgi:hypothetical protein